MANPFEFLDHLVELENKVHELEQLSGSTGLDMAATVRSLREQFEQETRRSFEHLTSWQRVLLARHPMRPQTSDHIDYMIDDFVPLAGDRAFADDPAIICGLGRIGEVDCLVMGHQKGKDVHERKRCNFGCPQPEGYRKALLKMRLAEKFRLPVLSLINTPGASPGIEAEERGQSIAIAENIREMARLRVPIIAAIIGEGGSGGALGIGVADRMLMLENSYYSVISPEGCAAILWKDGSKAPQAADSLRLTAHALRELGIIDEIVPEPPGGAHRQAEAMAANLKAAVLRQLHELRGRPIETVLDERYRRLRAIGAFQEPAAKG